MLILQSTLKICLSRKKLGAEKPSKSFFDACFERMEDGTKENTVLIGDSLSSDILGGVTSGVRTIWYNPKGLKENPEIPATVTITRLKEVLKVIELM